MQPLFEFSETALEHARNPRNLGSPPSWNGHACIKGPCGDTMEFWVLVEEGCLERVGFLTDGCGPSHACGSMTSLLARGKTLANALLLSRKDVLFALGGLPREVEHCALLAINTLHAACRHYVENHRSRKPVRGAEAVSGTGRATTGTTPMKPEKKALQGD